MPNSSRGTITRATRALVWSHSGGICAFPKCDTVCVLQSDGLESATVIGHIAHIEASSNEGPRANPSLPIHQVDSYSNLLLLCPTHHQLVDARPNSYTVEDLKCWKQRTEEQFRDYLAKSIGTITFAELETITQALTTDYVDQSQDFELIPPRDKIERNRLSEQTAILLRIGLLQAHQVQTFVETISGVDSRFAQRLTSGFATEYQRQRELGLDGDALFDAMRLYSCQGRTDIRLQSAGLAVLVYLFERCEVFEK